MRKEPRAWEKLYHVGLAEDGEQYASEREPVVAISEEDAANDFAKENWDQMDYPDSIEVLVKLAAADEWRVFSVTREMYPTYSAREIARPSA